MAPLLFDDDVLKGGPRQYRENPVVQAEEGQVASRVVGDGGADASDDDRNREREEQEREQHLTRATRDGHRSEERPDGADPHVREHDGGDRRPGDAAEEEAERRQRHRLDDEEERHRREHLPEPDRAAVARREHERVEDPLLALGHERAAEPQQRREDDRDPEEALRRGLLLRRERETERDEHREHEQRHRGKELLPAQLEEEVLACERGGVADVAAHPNATRVVASEEMRSGSWVATTSVRLAASSRSSRSRSSAPSASSAL